MSIVIQNKRRGKNVFLKCQLINLEEMTDRIKKLPPCKKKKEEDAKGKKKTTT